MPLRNIIFSLLLVFMFSIALGSSEVAPLSIKNIRQFLINEMLELNPSFRSASVTNETLVEAFIQELDKRGKKSVFVTDLDETLLTAKNFFGSTEWFKRSMPNISDQLKRQFSGLSDGEVDKKIDQIFWEYVTEHSEMRSVDALYTYLLKRLHESGHHVLALTARLPMLAENTRDQMKSIGLDFLFQKTIFSPHNSDWTSNKGAVLRQHAEIGFGEVQRDADFFRLYFFDDSPKEIEAVRVAFSKSPLLKPGQEIKIIHSQLSHTDRENDLLMSSFETIGKFQQAVYERTHVYLSNASAFRYSLKMTPIQFMCFQFYK